MSAESKKVFGYNPGEEFTSLGKLTLYDRLFPEFTRTGKYIIPDLTSSHPEISSMLSSSLLPLDDQTYIRAIIDADPINSTLQESVTYLLSQANSERGQRKIKERYSQKPVDLGEMLASYSHSERLLIAENLGGIQLTDGCTVGCEWCGINALRRTTTAFSFDSIGTFLTETDGHLLAEPTLYFASDPFDWNDGDYTYLDLHPMVSFYLPQRQGSYISTAVPLGSEFSILKFTEALYEAYKACPEQDKPQHREVIRFSLTDRNSERIKHMLRILKERGVSDEFIEHVAILDHTGDNVVNQGYFIKHPKRDIHKDSIGISCFDGVVISPTTGAKAYSTEVCTQANPQGWVQWDLPPGEMHIPLYKHISPADNPLQFENGQPVLFHLLPKTQIMQVREGQVTGTYELNSVGKDALTFALAARNIGYLAEEFQDPELVALFKDYPDMVDLLKQQLRIRKHEYEKRKVSYLQQTQDSKVDQEAVEIADNAGKNVEAGFVELDKLFDSIRPRRGIRYFAELIASKFKLTGS